VQHQSLALNDYKCSVVWIDQLWCNEYIFKPSSTIEHFFDFVCIKQFLCCEIYTFGQHQTISRDNNLYNNSTTLIPNNFGFKMAQQDIEINIVGFDIVPKNDNQCKYAFISKLRM
jgi:hypothetical protein